MSRSLPKQILSICEQPVYQAREAETLLQIIGQVRQEKPDLPMAYRMVLTDLEQRIQTDRSRATMNVAATLLAVATPAVFVPWNLSLRPPIKRTTSPRSQSSAGEAARWDDEGVVEATSRKFASWRGQTAGHRGMTSSLRAAEVAWHFLIGLATPPQEGYVRHPEFIDRPSLRSR